MNKCLVCKKTLKYTANYCCVQHYKLDISRYSGETIAEAIERKRLALQKKDVVLLKKN